MNPLPRNSIFLFEKGKPWTLSTSTAVLHSLESLRKKKKSFRPVKWSYVDFIEARWPNGFYLTSFDVLDVIE